MKKITRTVWVGILSGLALLTACFSSKGLTKAERNQLVQERDSIQRVIHDRENSCVYGSPEIIKAYGAETQRLRDKVKEINARLEQDEQKKN